MIKLKSAAAKKIHARNMVENICKDMGVSYRNLINKSNDKKSVELRKVVSYKLYYDEGISFNIIGYTLKRHHTTIMGYFKGMKRNENNI